jgi:hypothetical protein
VEQKYFMGQKYQDRKTLFPFMYKKRNPHMPFIIHVQIKLHLWPRELTVLSSHRAEFSEEDKAVF